jgi:hypothetical protein
MFFVNYPKNDKILGCGEFTINMSSDFLDKVFLKLDPIPGRIQRGVIINVLWTSCKVPDTLFDFNQIWMFSTDFNKSTQSKMSLKPVQWETPCFMPLEGRAEREADMAKQTVIFRNSANAP